MIASLSVLVLLLDDHESLRRNLSALLEDEGFGVVQASSGEEALQLLFSTRVDVAIVDIRLPSMNGHEFIQAAHAKNADLHFMIYTGTINYQLPDALRRIGLTDDNVFIKPITDPVVLFDRLIALSQH